MNKPRVSVLIGLAAALLLGVAIGRPGMAMMGYSAGLVAKGTVQNIDYLHHTITVNGQTYAVSPQARFRGVASFSVLHVGMPIQYVLGSDSTQAPSDPADNDGTSSDQADDQPLVIVSITWLPGGV